MLASSVFSFDALTGNVNIAEGSVGGGSTEVNFWVNRSDASGTESVVVSTSDGTATVANSDYDGLSQTLTFEDGEGSIFVSVTTRHDTTPEGNETFTVNLSSPSPGGSISGTDGSRTITLTNDDGATVSINDVSLAEGQTGTTPFTFTISLSQPVNRPVVVQVATADDTATAPSDYTAKTQTLTFKPFATSKTFTVLVNGDRMVEPTETFQVNVTPVSLPASVTITDSQGIGTILNDDMGTVSVTATDPLASETPTNPGQFTVSLDGGLTTGTELVVTYGVSGSATPTGDYAALSGTVTIPAGGSSATIDVSGIVDDTIIEGDETVVVTLIGTSNPAVTANPLANQATVTIDDNDDDEGVAQVTITATDGAAGETPTNPGEFTVSLGALTTAADLTVNYTVSGSATPTADYTALTGSVVIPAGSGSATIAVAGIVDDLIIEGNETVIATLTGTSNGAVTVGTPSAATVTIADNDATTVSITANDPNAAEAGSDPGQFTVSLDGGKTTQAQIVVTYTVNGSATGGADYTALSGSVTIPASDSSATINVEGIVDDAIVEFDETVIVTLSGTNNPDVTPASPPNNSATVTIVDNEPATVSITATDADGTEPGTPGTDPGPNDGQFTVSLDGGLTTQSNLTVFYTVTGSATGGSDYTALSGTATILAGNGSVTIPVDVLDDSTVEGDETVIVLLTGTSNVGVTVNPAADDATVTIADDDAATVTIDNVAVNEADGTLTFTLSLDRALDIELVVNVAYTDVTTGSGDFDHAADAVTFPAGSTAPQSAAVAVTEDRWLEPAPETFTAALSTSTPLGGRLVNLSDTGTGTIADDEAILDDEDAGYSQTGFTHVPTPPAGLEGYLTDWSYSEKGTGADVASWTAGPGISYTVRPGIYQVLVTWVPYPNRATNARFSVRDRDPGEGINQLEGVFPINQQLAPAADDTLGGRPFQFLGRQLVGDVYEGHEFYITGTEIRVELSDDANNYVIADGVLIARIGNLPQVLTVGLEDTEVFENTHNRTADGEPALVGRVYRDPGTVGDLVVVLTSDDITAARLMTGPDALPSSATITVTIPSGQRSVPFYVDIIDDLVADGTQTVTLTATAAGYVDGTEMLDVTDNEPNFVDDEDRNSDNVGYSETPTGWFEVAQELYPGYAGTGGMPGWTPDNPSYGDWRYHTGFGTGSNWAQWEATNVTPGQYEVYVTWAPFNNRASNALYTIYDGGPAGTVEGAFQLDQENPPRADVTAGGRPFQLLGTYLIDSTSLSVRLTDDANGYVIADAVRFVRVGDLPPKLVVEIPVSVATEPGGTVVATVTRLYGGTLTDLVVALGTSDASEATADPVTVTIPAGSSSTTFNVLVQDDNLADRTQTVTITATAVGFVPGTDSLQVLDDEIWTIDDEDPGYSETPVWTEAEVAGYPGYAGIGDPSYGDWRYRPAGDGSSVATWQVTTGRPGQYEVFVTWAPFTNRAPNAPYKVYDGPAVGGTLEGTFPINQQNAPVAHVTFGGRPFQRLGTFTISSTTLAVTLSNLANNYVIADAVQFARVGDGPLRAAGGAAAGGAAAALTAEQAQGLLAEAAGRWQSAGLAADVQLVIADLPGDLLGMASSADQTIWLDADAAGYGWYVDATPWEDEEFDEEPDEEAADRMDALSVIFHELGHLQGLADVDGLLHPDDRMADLLAVGVRRAFASADHDAALAELLGDGQ